MRRSATSTRASTRCSTATTSCSTCSTAVDSTRVSTGSRRTADGRVRLARSMVPASPRCSPPKARRRPRGFPHALPTKNEKRTRWPGSPCGRLRAYATCVLCYSLPGTSPRTCRCCTFANPSVRSCRAGPLYVGKRSEIGSESRKKRTSR
eukprot:116664-Prymnesium_polylepis.1